MAVDFEKTGAVLQRQGLTLALMESCTGGLFSATVSSTPGCGEYYLGGITSYATEIKVWAGVSQATIAEQGVVSAETAIEMSQVIRSRFGADIGIGITGVAGPKPQDGVQPGIVYVGIDGGKRFPAEVRQLDFRGQDPDAIKQRAVEATIEWLTERLVLLERETIRGV